jgi:putative Ca2+/H+ antiporter (TMEM165/GDT1 family)
MDALLLALLACLAGEMGGRGQLLALVLGVRYRAAFAVLAGVVLAACINAALSAYAASLIAGAMNRDASHLFMAIAFLSGGISLALPPKAPDTLAGWKTGPFLTALFGLFVLGFGEGAQFLIAGISVARGNPALAALGGALGVTLACVPAVLVGGDFFTRWPVRWLRLGTAFTFLIVGGWIAVAALGLT